MKQSSKMIARLTPILSLFICVLFIVCSVSGFRFLKNPFTKTRSRPAITTAPFMPIKQSETAARSALTECVPQKIDFKAWQNVNPDVYAYIEIPGTTISYPVLQSSTQEEDYYLNTTVEKKAGLPGSIYTRMINDRNFTDPNTIIYGHDMADGSYFGSLKAYVDRSFFDSHRDIYIYLPNWQLHYQVIAEVVYDDRYIPMLYDFKSADSVIPYMQDLQNIQEPENQFAADISVTTGDKLITLCTCIGNRENNRRLIVAKLMDKKLAR